VHIPPPTHLFDVGGRCGAAGGEGAEDLFELGLGFGVAVLEEQANATPDAGVGGVRGGLEAAVDVEDRQVGVAPRQVNQDAPLVRVQVVGREADGFFVVGQDGGHVDARQVGRRRAGRHVGRLGV